MGQIANHTLVWIGNGEPNSANSMFGRKSFLEVSFGSTLEYKIQEFVWSMEFLFGVFGSRIRMEWMTPFDVAVCWTLVFGIQIAVKVAVLFALPAG